MYINICNIYYIYNIYNVYFYIYIYIYIFFFERLSTSFSTPRRPYLMHFFLRALKRSSG